MDPPAKRKKREKMESADLIVVSFPKSGRTWLRYFFERYHHHLLGLHPNIKPPRIVFTHGWFDKAFGPQDRPGEIKIVDSDLFLSKPTVFLFRDPRAVAASYYWHITRRDEQWQGSFKDFVRHPGWGIERQCDYVLKLMQYRCQEKILYEKLLSVEGRSMFRRLVFLSKHRWGERVFMLALRNAKFKNMQRHEINLSNFGESTGRLGVFNWDGDLNRLKCRSGKAGGWRHEFNEKFDPAEFPLMAKVLTNLEAMR